MTYKKKLIEVALPLAKINFESSKEKSVRHGHPSTLHLWWARRPFGSARAIIWASLINDPSSEPERFPTIEDQHIERSRLFGILEKISAWNSIHDEKLFELARKELKKSCGDDLPTICDPFGGGGAIPVESVRLGLPTVTGDINPVAVTIQRAMLQVPQRFAGKAPISNVNHLSKDLFFKYEGFALDIEKYARDVITVVKQNVGHLYADEPDADPAEGPMAYIWARTVPSPDPGWKGEVPLAGNWILRKTNKRPTIWIQPVVDTKTQSVTYKICEGGDPTAGTIQRAKAVCIATGAAITNDYIRECAKKDNLSSTVISKIYDSEHGRRYVSGDSIDTQKGKTLLGDVWCPDGKLSTHSQYMAPPRYGLDEWGKLFLPRQLTVISSLVNAIDEIQSRIRLDAIQSGLEEGLPLRENGHGAIAYAEAITMFLAFVLDRSVSRWNTLSIWDNTRETVQHLFRMQAYQMTWSFAEANPFSDASGGWEGQIQWVVKALRDLPVGEPAVVDQVSAKIRVTTFTPNVLITDPPYYDSVPYSDLSDFFYVFLRKTLSKIWPDEFATLTTPKQEELVADHERHGGKLAAKEHFENGMKEVFSAASLSANDQYPAVIYYAFRSTEEDVDGTSSTGWETFLESLLQGGWSVVRTWPIRTEMTSGLKVTKNMLASSIVLVCRRRSVTAPLATKSEFISALRNEMPPELKILLQENIAPVDLAQSAIGPGMAIFSRYARVIESYGQTMTVKMALAQINEVLAEVLSGEESEFDADTRFAVTWFEQFGHNPGVFGDADTLAKAKNTTVSGVIESGVASSKEGKIRLLERKELSNDWDPTKDSRLTVWETTQHLIRALEVSESDASELLKKIGNGYGEKARQLAYLLYGICDRKKWAAEAGAYNMLITAWPEIEKLALQEPAGEPSSETLF